MIAACPRCAARYRVDREKLRPEGVKLRCTRCEAVFRVRAPEAAPAEVEPRVEAPPAAVSPPPAPVPAPQEARKAVAPPQATPPRSEAPPDPARSVLVAVPDADLAKRTAEALEGRGLRPQVVHDGVEAMLEVQRKLPRTVVLSATLPKMYGFQVCEVMKRNEGLRGILVLLVGSVHHPERYRRPPGDLYGADGYLEEPDLPDALWPLLERHGVPLAPAAEAAPHAPRPAAASPPTPAPERAPAAAPPAAPADGLAEERAKAERLARIIVSDIVLYNEEKFRAAAASGDVVAALADELGEGRALFVDRVDQRVRSERDHLADELRRVARARAGG